ncbi:MAG: hypothetical protein Q9198_010840 [Flavoplaca austrocitrina]
MMMILSAFLLTLITLLPFTTAQFQFFEQMFQGGHQHQQHQQPQNVASDSEWYQQTYESGIFLSPSSIPSPLPTFSISQPIAQTTSAPPPSPASISHTTAHARSQPSKIKSN